MEFKNTEIWGFEHAFRGMRNPFNSWHKSDSYNGFIFEDDFEQAKKDRCIGQECVYNDNWIKEYGCTFVLGQNDKKLAQNLLKAGSEHSKFMRMIHVSVDIDMPRYWWSEADTYHFNTKNSCSTMHKLLNNDNPITMDMFVICEEDKEWWKLTINKLEKMRQEYKTEGTATQTKERLLVRAKRMLPEGFLQLRTFDTTYAELRNMYFQRRHHRLKEEWVETFCKWVESLPYAKELIMYTGD